ncbi:RNA 2',3'-cyclic phosphodiesterase [Domibacillus indicus]|uniref:RNA 2',3'-cyclic phosphodiesterase n=1 Tax=Domibacillus indicus TaxID=1437523 RepID=UPI00203B0B4A|nr:RNA 2',3'-cyclic phosphodiesterase [Domibacillus indicus]MCM3787003.1 RNA 2',3'-cyclic phosphodiesterase [Domibacillus indicus]
MQPHYFFALVLPDDVKEKIADEMKGRNELFKRLVHKEDYHLTLAFVGAADLSGLEKACVFIEENIKHIPVFELKLTSFGTFGQKTSPRIFWIGTNEPSSLFDVQKGVAAACRKAGISIDEKPFRPHITTARKWAGSEPYVPDVLPEWPSFPAAEIALYETKRAPGPKYVKKWSCLLSGSGEEQEPWRN